MSEYRDLPSGSVLPASWLKALQQYIGTAANNFRMSIMGLTTDTVVVDAGSGRALVGLGIEGLWRYNTSPVSVSASGMAAGTYDIYAVCDSNSFSNTPTPDTDNTNYSFALQILAHGATPTISGAVQHYRKVGELDWDGDFMIRELRTLVGDFDANAVNNLLAPGPWFPIALQSALMSDATGGSRPPAARLVPPDRVEFRGSIHNTSGSAITPSPATKIASIPAQWAVSGVPLAESYLRPAQTVYPVSAADSGQAVSLAVYPDGSFMLLTPLAAGASISLDGPHYVLP